MVNAGPLRGLGCLGLCLCRDCDEGDERVADCLLHRYPMGNRGTTR